MGVLCKRDKAVSEVYFWCLKINQTLICDLGWLALNLVFVLEGHVDELSGFRLIIGEVLDFWCEKQQRNGWKHFIKGWKQVLRQRQGNPGQSIKMTETCRGRWGYQSYSTDSTGVKTPRWTTVFYAEGERGRFLIANRNMLQTKGKPFYTLVCNSTIRFRMYYTLVKSRE